VSKQIRNLGVFLTLCYVLLFAQLNRYTVFDAKELQEKPGNNRKAERDFSAPRGTISTADGVLLANSVELEDPDSRFKRQRLYPTGELFSQIVGTFNPLSTGTFGVEKTYNDELAGDLGIGVEQLGNLLEDEEQVGNVTLTLRNDVQIAARDALAGVKGSVVVMDPRTGAIIAAYSNPTYDPAPVASHDFSEALKAAEALDLRPDKPRVAPWYRQNLPPGSTIKVVTATAGIEAGTVTPEDPVYPEVSEYTPRGAGTTIENSNGGGCGGTLFIILQRSCNTSFAQMGEEDIDGAQLYDTAAAYGFNQDVPIDLPNPGRSSYTPRDRLDDPALRAQTAIGGQDVRGTPLQMAMVAAAVANGGDIMKPHVLKEIRDNDGAVVKSYDEGTWTTSMSATTAGILKSAMIGVVANGTGERLDEGLEGYEVGGKTGTAPIAGTDSSHAWIIGFAGPPDKEPELVVAVVVEGAPGQGEQFGGRTAAPIAAAVLRQALQPITAPSEGGDQDEDGD
jgi:peptidoglycan glycosyltransferase